MVKKKLGSFNMELKARHIVDVYESYYAENPFGERSQVYLKSEADEVIALLKDKANYDEYAYKLKSEELAGTCRFYEKELRLQKYKRCLAMAKWCEATALWCYQAACTLPKGFNATLHDKPVMIEPARLFNRQVLLTKWSQRWLELAEKFKEAK